MTICQSKKIPGLSKDCKLKRFSPFCDCVQSPISHIWKIFPVSLLIPAGTRRSGFGSSAAAAGSRTGTGCCSRRRSGPYSCSSSSASSNSNNNSSSSRGPSPWCRWTSSVCCLRLQQQQPCPAQLLSPTSENHFWRICSRSSEIKFRIYRYSSFIPKHFLYFVLILHPACVSVRVSAVRDTFDTGVFFQRSFFPTEGTIQ